MNKQWINGQRVIVEISTSNEREIVVMGERIVLFIDYFFS